MSRYTGRNAQRLIQSKAGFVSVAALLCLSAPVKLAAQPTATEGQQPSAEQSTRQPQQTRNRRAARRRPTGQQPPAAQTPPAQQTTTPATPPTPPATRPPRRRPATPTPPDATHAGGRDAAADRLGDRQPAAGAGPARAGRARTAAAPAAAGAQPAPGSAPATVSAATAARTESALLARLSGVDARRRPHRDAAARHAADRQRGDRKQVIREQNVATVRDALRNVAGVTFRAGEGGNQGDTPYIRGFSAQNDIFRDGVRDPGWYTRDAFAVDAVEVYKGPASVLFGRGSTGGVINLISKFPFERNVVEGTITGNTGWGARATLDANGQVNENIWGRVVAMSQDYHTPGRDNVEQNRYGFSPSLMYKASDTKITAAYISPARQQRARLRHSVHVAGVRHSALGLAGSAQQLVRHPERSQPRRRTGHRAGRNGEDRAQLHQRLQGHQHHALNDVNRLQRNVFPEPNATVPPPSALNQLWTPNRAQVLVKNTQIVNQTDALTALLDRAVAGAQGRGRLRPVAGVARLPAQQLRRHGADQLPRSRPVALRRRRARADREPVALRRGAEHRRLHRRPDQDHQVVRSAGKLALRRVRLPSGRAGRRSRASSISSTDRQVSELARRGGRPSDREDQRLRDARHVVQPVGRQPVDLRHQRGGRAQPRSISRRKRRRRPKSAPRPRCSTASSRCKPPRSTR